MIASYRAASATRAACRKACWLSTGPPKPPASAAATVSKPKPVELKGSAAQAKTQGIGSAAAQPGVYIKDRGPVSWPSLFLVGIAAASCVAYYNIERERRLETMMGRVVSSESDGWTPNPEVMAPRKFKLTPWGYFPEEDAFGAGT
jgi:hypothetical protein